MEDDALNLRRLFNDQERIQRPLLTGSGEHGVVILIAVKEFEYVFKFVSTIPFIASARLLGFLFRIKGIMLRECWLLDFLIIFFLPYLVRVQMFRHFRAGIPANSFPKG